MADELDHYRQLLMDDRRETHALAAEARAALAQPEPQGPTDEELKAAYWEAFKDAAPCGAEESWLEGLRAVARWGRPAIKPVPVNERLSGLEGPTYEALASFTAWFCRNYPGPDTIIHKPEWHAPKVFRAAESAIARWGRPAIKPVPQQEAN
jgi:hypothetical protein